MVTANVILLILALLCFVLGAFNVTTASASRINWQSLGLAFLALAYLLR